MNILLITPYFPSFDVQKNDQRTKFLYYYAVEWIKQGHKVLIIHCPTCYPKIFSFAVEKLERYIGIKNLLISNFKQNQKALEDADYVFDNVRIVRKKIRKYIPHRNYFPWDLSRHTRRVVEKYCETGIKADIIISDFLTPSAFIADKIAKKNGTTFFQVIHRSDYNYLKNSTELKGLLNNSAGILLRSKSQKKFLQKNGLSEKYKDFMYTGVPNNTQFGFIKKSVKKILFVGRLHEKKNIHVILEAIAASHGKKVFNMEIVGEGAYKEILEKKVVQFDLQENVKFCGKLSRNEVFKKMRNSDCLIMVSNETYGMVYIEALSQGCITVASKNQGVDGIIVDGENGFLVESGNVEELTNVLNKVAKMNENEIGEISKKGIETARNMKDGKLAEDLIDRLYNYQKKYIG